MDPTTLQLLNALSGGKGGRQPGFLEKATQPATFMFPGSAISYSPVLDFGNLGLFPGGESLGPLIGMFVEPMLTSMVGPNYTPLQFSGIQNPYDIFRKRQEYQQMMRFAGLWTPQDQAQLVRFIRGMATLSGTPWSLEQEAAARATTEQLSQFLPYVGMAFPGFVDAIYGREGSQVHLARQIFSTARYRMDPFFGGRGLSEPQMALLLEEISRRLYGPDAEVNLAQRYGLGKAELGGFIEYAARMGLGPRTLSHQEAMMFRALDAGQQVEILRGMRFGGGFPFGQAEVSPLQVLRSANQVLGELKEVASSPEMQNFLQTFDAQRMVSFYRDMADAISAMKDIFGGLGISDAPLPQIMEGLKVLSSGGLYRMEPKQLAELMRNLQVSSRLSQMDMNSMTVLVSNTAKFLESFGGDISLAPHIAAQVAIRNAALANQGLGITRGGIDREKYQAYEMRLHAQAASSPAAMNLAALYRMVQDMGYKPREGTEAEALVQALLRGESQYTFQGQERAVYDPQRFMDIMRQSGLPMEVFLPASQSRIANQTTIRDNPQLISIVRDMQAGEMLQHLRQRMQLVQLPNVAQADSFRLANAYLDLIFSGKYGLDITPASRDPRAFEMFLLALKENPQILQRYGIRADFLDQLQEKDMPQLRALFQRTWEEIGRAAETFKYESPDAMINLMSGATTEYRQVLEVQKQMDMRMMEAFSGIGRGSFSQRLIEAIKTATPQTTTKDILAQALGYVPTEDFLTPDLMQTVEELRNLQENFTGASRNVVQTNQAFNRLRAGLNLASRQIMGSFAQVVRQGAIPRDDPFLNDLERRVTELIGLRDPREVVKKAQEILNSLPDEDEIAKDAARTEAQKNTLIQAIRSSRQTLKVLILYAEAYIEQHRRTFGDTPFAETQGKSVPEQMRQVLKQTEVKVPDQIREFQKRLASFEGQVFIRSTATEAARVYGRLRSGMGGGERAVTDAVSLASRVLLDDQALELVGERGARAALTILQTQEQLRLFSEETGLPTSVLTLPREVIEKAEEISRTIQTESEALTAVEREIQQIRAKGEAATPQEKERLATLLTDFEARSQRIRRLNQQAQDFSSLYGVSPMTVRQAMQRLTPEGREIAFRFGQDLSESVYRLSAALGARNQMGPVQPVTEETQGQIRKLREQVELQTPGSDKQREFLRNAIKTLFGLDQVTVRDETLKSLLAAPGMDKQAARFAQSVQQFAVLSLLRLPKEQDERFAGDRLGRVQYIAGRLEEASRLLKSDKAEEIAAGRKILQEMGVAERDLPALLLTTRSLDFDALRSAGKALQAQVEAAQAGGVPQVEVSEDVLRNLVKAMGTTPAAQAPVGPAGLPELPPARHQPPVGQAPVRPAPDLRGLLALTPQPHLAGPLQAIDQTQRARSLSPLLMLASQPSLVGLPFLIPHEVPGQAPQRPEEPKKAVSPEAIPVPEAPPPRIPATPVSSAPGSLPQQQLAIVGTLNIPGIGSGTIRGFGYYSNVGGARS